MDLKPRRRLRMWPSLLGLLALLSAGTAHGADAFIVVVNKDSALSQIDRDDLTRIYSGKKTLWEVSGSRILPALIEDGSGPPRAFLDAILKKTPGQYRAYWRRLLFSGGGTAPKAFRTASQVLEFVASQPGGIGIVEAAGADPRVRVIPLSN